MLTQKMTQSKFAYSNNSSNQIFDQINAAQNTAPGFISKNIERNNDEVIITIVWNNKEDYYNFIKNNAQLYIDSFIERQNFVLANNIKTTLELIEN